MPLRTRWTKSPSVDDQGVTWASICLYADPHWPHIGKAVEQFLLDSSRIEVQQSATCGICTTCVT